MKSNGENFNSLRLNIKKKQKLLVFNVSKIRTCAIVNYFWKK